MRSITDRVSSTLMDLRKFLILLESGQAQERIDQFARSVDADIIVVKKKQRNLLEKIFHKSFTNGVALSSPTPVLIIK
ncbi:MAG: universal stress protein [Saprospiraceae bacterium]|nr:universal stress protein [Saprospiraceae bacterium]